MTEFREGSEDQAERAQAARIAALPGRWSRTSMSKRLHFIVGDAETTICGIFYPHLRGQGWAEVDLKRVCGRCLRALRDLCPEPGELSAERCGPPSVPSLGSSGSLE